MKLFEGESRLSLSAATINMSDYNVIKYCRRGEIATLKNILESWYQEYPDSAKLDLKKRLMKQENFDAAFFELYIFKLFSNLGYELTSHPNITNNDCHPDFFATNGKQKLFIEAKVCFDSTRKDKAENNRKAAILESINSIIDGRFGLAIKSLEIRGAQPSAKNLVKSIKNRFSKLEYEKVSKSIYNDSDCSEEFEYVDNGISISCRIFAYRFPIDTNPVVAIDASCNGYGISYYEKIRNAIMSKAGKYGKLDYPYLICINLPEAFVGNNDVIAALFYRPECRLLINRERGMTKVINTSIPDGLFYNGNPNCANVSAVLIFQMRKETIGCPKYWLVFNSGANLQLEQHIFPLGNIRFFNDRMTTVEERTPVNEILGIPKQWIESILAPSVGQF